MIKKNKLLLNKKSSKSGLLNLLYLGMQMKDLYRQGWLKVGVPEEKCESDADHCYSVVLLSFLLAMQLFPELDVNRVIKIAILHDLAEAVVGDFTPWDKITPKEKHEKERIAIKSILAPLNNSAELFNYWDEYDRASSPEARLVKQVDKLEIYLQASIYKSLFPIDFTDFLTNSRRKITDKRLLKIVEDVT